MNSKKQLPPFLFFPLLIIFSVIVFFLLENSVWPEINRYGIIPGKSKGLIGILLSPVKHKDFAHLYHNIIAFFITASLLFYYHRKYAWRILFTGMIITGSLTWIIGRPGIHIGLSGINYMLFAFLIFSGFFSKNPGLTAISLILIFLYGGLIWLIFPLMNKISWEGHLSGFLTGIFFGFILAPAIKKNYKNEEKSLIYQEDDEFILCFDEYGNFIEKNSSENEIIENR